MYCGDNSYRKYCHLYNRRTGKEEEDKKRLTLLKLRCLKKRPPEVGLWPLGTQQCLVVLAVGVSELRDGVQGAGTQTSKKGTLPVSDLCQGTPEGWFWEGQQNSKVGSTAALGMNCHCQDQEALLGWWGQKEKQTGRSKFFASSMLERSSCAPKWQSLAEPRGSWNVVCSVPSSATTELSMEGGVWSWELRA